MENCLSLRYFNWLFLPQNFAQLDSSVWWLRTRFVLTAWFIPRQPTWHGMGGPKVRFLMNPSYEVQRLSVTLHSAVHWSLDHLPHGVSRCSARHEMPGSDLSRSWLHHHLLSFTNSFISLGHLSCLISILSEMVEWCQDQSRSCDDNARLTAPW